jgi:hypothetical protein
VLQQGEDFVTQKWSRMTIKRNEVIIYINQKKTIGVCTFESKQLAMSRLLFPFSRIFKLHHHIATTQLRPCKTIFNLLKTYAKCLSLNWKYRMHPTVKSSDKVFIEVSLAKNQLFLIENVY